MKNQHHIGRWELSCIVFNSLIYKLFTAYPEKYVKCGGSAAWVTSLFSGAVFLIILWIVLKIYDRFADKGIIETINERFGENASKTVAALGGLYFAFSLGYTFYLICDALKNTVFINSPIWFTGLFFALGAIITVIYGEKAVLRMHSLSALGIGITILLICLFGFYYADIYNLYPLLGKGPLSVFGKGLSTLFMYADILIIFFLPRHSGNYSFKRTVMQSAIAAVILNIIAITSFSLNVTYELAEKITLPLYPLTKSANFGKFPIRLDMAYQTALLFSAYLHISLLLNMVVKSFCSVSFSARKASKAMICLFLCITLCGCYDSSEIEEKAYVAALGIDKGDVSKYKYTFQLSNPLESGGSIGAEEKAAEKSGEDKSNKTVDNITVEADNYFHAGDKLKGILSKEFDMSHIKLIVLSTDTAAHEALSHSELLLREREVRPGTNICLVKSAVDFLNDVKPTLEANTVRYYELVFGNNDTPTAPITTLRDFVGRSSDKGYDAVVPIIKDSSLSGMGIFSDGKLKEELGENDAFVYKLLCGELKNAAIDGCVISSNGKPKTDINMNNDIPEIMISVNLKIIATNGNSSLDKLLSSKAESFLYKCSKHQCDILGFGRMIKSKCLTQKQWEDFDWDSSFQKSQFTIKITTKTVKKTKILQNL